MRRTVVVAGAILDDQGRVLITERPAGKHLAGGWEFPGGKLAEGESDADALQRELREELGIEVTAQQPFMVVEHDYSDRKVELRLRIVRGYAGEPRGLDGQRLRWVEIQRLTADDLLEADRPFIAALQRLRN